MVVRITNLTDGPGQRPREVRVYNKRLKPGSFMDVPAQFVDDKMRRLERSGYVAIGGVPPWYADYRAKRKVRNLTSQEVTANVEARKAYERRQKAGREEAHRLANVSQVKALEYGLKELKKDEPVVVEQTPAEPVEELESSAFDLSDADDESVSVGKESRGRKKRK